MNPNENSLGKLWNELMHCESGSEKSREEFWLMPPIHKTSHTCKCAQFREERGFTLRFNADLL